MAYMQSLVITASFCETRSTIHLQSSQLIPKHQNFVGALAKLPKLNPPTRFSFNLLTFRRLVGDLDRILQHKDGETLVRH